MSRNMALDKTAIVVVFVASAPALRTPIINQGQLAKNICG